jgi:hypothetical protein
LAALQGSDAGIWRRRGLIHDSSEDLCDAPPTRRSFRVFDTLRTAVANAEADLDLLLALQGSRARFGHDLDANGAPSRFGGEKTPFGGVPGTGNYCPLR